MDECCEVVVLKRTGGGAESKGGYLITGEDVCRIGEVWPLARYIPYYLSYFPGCFQ